MTMNACQNRLCLWTPDASISPTLTTPHPLKLSDTIQTAHRANIFSAKYLPKANHPTIASVAGDGLVLVYDVERLDRLNNARQEYNGIVSHQSGSVIDCVGRGRGCLTDQPLCSQDRESESSCVTRIESKGRWSRIYIPIRC